MLDEGRRRNERGTADVVVGLVETHNRPKTIAQLAGLELVPRKTIEYRGQHFEEMDVDAILARRPEVALVDELAHTNVPGSRNAKRWQDIEELLDAGINVISTVNIQHLESLNDVVERITGVSQRETVPDAIVRAADQIELVDMSPEALRRRMAHGNIYSADRIDTALANYFRIGNLAALRELALLWVADRVDENLQEYRERHDIADCVGDEGTRARRAHRRARGRRPRAPRRAHRDAAPAPSSSVCTCSRPTGWRARAPATSTRTARCSRSSAATTTRSRAPTWHARSCRSRVRRTRRRCCWARATVPAGPSSRAAR